jgi:glutathione S-transferase
MKRNGMIYVFRSPHRSFFSFLKKPKLDTAGSISAQFGSSSPSSQLKLTYFDGRGRGEQIRLLLHEVGAPFEDNRISYSTFGKMRITPQSKLSFHSVPLLEDGEYSLVQGPVIMSYISRKFGLYPKDWKEGLHADAYTLGAEDLRTLGFAHDDAVKKARTGDALAQKRVKEFVDAKWKSRWLPNLERLLIANSSKSGFCVGNSITHADIAFFDVVTYITQGFPDAVIDKKQTPVAFQWYEQIKQRPNISQYLLKRK